MVFHDRDLVMVRNVMMVNFDGTKVHSGRRQVGRRHETILDAFHKRPVRTSHWVLISSTSPKLSNRGLW